MLRWGMRFWSSDILTGSQTVRNVSAVAYSFWSSDILTGSQTSPLLKGLKRLVLEQ